MSFTPGEQAALGVIVVLATIGVGLFVASNGLAFAAGMAWMWAMVRVMRWVDGA